MVSDHAPHAKKTKTGSVLTWLLLLCISTPLVTEIALRGVLGLGNPVLITPDAACGYTLKPDQDIHRFFVHTHINDWAMRSDDVPMKPAPGTLRILFLGDSITYGTSRVDQSDIFAGILDRELAKTAHRPVEVLNASAGGWAIENELAYLRSRGTFGAALVVDVLNSADLTQPPAELSPVESDYFVKRPRTAIGELWDRFHPMIHRRDAGKVTEARNEATMKENLADLDQIRGLAGKNHAGFALVYIPFRAEIPHPSEESRKVFAGWARENGVTFVDLTELEVQYQGKQITFDGKHLNKRGNQLAASYLEAHLPLQDTVRDRK